MARYYTQGQLSCTTATSHEGQFIRNDPPRKKAKIKEGENGG
jgi:hypothetical protein